MGLLPRRTLALAAAVLLSGVTGTRYGDGGKPKRVEVAASKAGKASKQKRGRSKRSDSAGDNMTSELRAAMRRDDIQAQVERSKTRLGFASIIFAGSQIYTRHKARIKAERVDLTQFTAEAREWVQRHDSPIFEGIVTFYEDVFDMSDVDGNGFLNEKELEYSKFLRNRAEMPFVPEHPLVPPRDTGPLVKLSAKPIGKMVDFVERGELDEDEESTDSVGGSSDVAPSEADSKSDMSASKTPTARKAFNMEVPEVGRKVSGLVAASGEKGAIDAKKQRSSRWWKPWRKGKREPEMDASEKQEEAPMAEQAKLLEEIASAEKETSMDAWASKGQGPETSKASSGKSAMDAWASEGQAAKTAKVKEAAEKSTEKSAMDAWASESVKPAVKAAKKSAMDEWASEGQAASPAEEAPKKSAMDAWASEGQAANPAMEASEKSTEKSAMLAWASGSAKPDEEAPKKSAMDEWASEGQAARPAEEASGKSAMDAWASEGQAAKPIKETWGKSAMDGWASKGQAAQPAKRASAMDAWASEGQTARPGEEASAKSAMDAWASDGHSAEPAKEASGMDAWASKGQGAKLANAASGKVASEETSEEAGSEDDEVMDRRRRFASEMGLDDAVELLKTYDANSDGKIDRDEYKTGMRVYAQGVGWLDGFDDPDMVQWREETWNQVDLDGDGALNANEVHFLSMICESASREGRFLTQQLVSKIFQDLDLKRSGKISHSDIKKGLAKPGREPRWKATMPNTKSRRSAVEGPQATLYTHWDVVQTLDSMFEEADKDRDGSLSRDETMRIVERITGSMV